MYWLSRISEHSNSYAGGVLGPLLVIAVSLGLLFVPVTLVAMSRVADEEPGVAASLRNTASRSAARLGWRCWELSPGPWWPTASTPRPPVPRPRPAPVTRDGPARAALTAVYHHALATGFSRAFVVTARIMLLALVITIIAIRVKRADLGGARL